MMRLWVLPIPQRMVMINPVFGQGSVITICVSFLCICLGAVETNFVQVENLMS
jgi:hypothetical protein